MCFTFLGRVHTRLFASVIGMLVVCVFAWGYSCPDFFVVWLFMTGAGLVLDVLVYSVCIRYQPVALTVLLGFFEYAVLAVMLTLLAYGEHGPFSFVGVFFYASVWLIGFVVIQTLLPVVLPQFREDGGELV